MTPEPMSPQEMTQVQLSEILDDALGFLEKAQAKLHEGIGLVTMRASMDLTEPWAITGTMTALASSLESMAEEILDYTTGDRDES